MGYNLLNMKENILTHLSNPPDEVIAAVHNWQAMREAVNALFVGTKRRRKPQTFHEVDRVRSWDNVATGRDVRHQSVTEDWQDDFDVPISEPEYVDPFYDSSDDDFDWEDFKAGGTGIVEKTVKKSGGRFLKEPKKLVDTRDTAEFRDMDSFMRRNGPKTSPTKRFVR